MEVKEIKEKIANVYSCKVIPLAFDESMSYLEQLCNIKHYLVNEVVSVVNSNAELLQQLKNTVDGIDINFERLQNQIDILNNRINQTISELHTYTEQELQRQYNEIVTLMNNYQIIFNSQLNTAVTELNQKIEAIELGNVDAYNPTNGNIENINKVLQDIYDSVRYDALTVNEFEALDLTATEFDSKNISAYSFDVNGKSILQ